MAITATVDYDRRPMEKTKNTTPRQPKRTFKRRRKAQAAPSTSDREASEATTPANTAAPTQIDVADMAKRPPAPSRQRAGRKRTRRRAQKESTAEQAPPPVAASTEAPITQDASEKSPGAPASAPAAGKKTTHARRRGTGRRRKSGTTAPVPEQSTATTPAREGHGTKTVREPVRAKRKMSASSRHTTTGSTAPRTPRPKKAQPAPKKVAPSGGREMLINVSAGDECRIAVLHEGKLEELFIERESTQSHVGNIYKGRVTNIEASIQAVFVDFGLTQNGFLHISDVQPQYFPDHKRGDTEDVGRKIPRHNRPPIQKCFRRGQEVIVQVTKEGVGTKGPTLTTYLSLPGRFLVMMPGMNRHGVSRKIEDEADRRTMRDMLNELDLPSGIGFILRTAGLDRAKREIQRDLHYLQRLWKTVTDRIRREPAPTGLYQESDLVTRTIRDIYTTDFDRIIVDDKQTAEKAKEFLQIALPRSKATVEFYSEREPLFHRFKIEEEIEKIHMRHVPLSSGGSIVIDSTEALVAIDVNSGRFRTTEDAEETAFKINIEAAEEIARQLRLRDLGGLIMCDFIDMRLDRHKRTVERTLREAVKKHKERAKILRMSAFGIIEMTRQRQGPSLNRNIYYDCPHCNGTGLVKMPDSMILDVMRNVQDATTREEVQKVIVTVANDVAYQILNEKRALLAETEADTGKEIVVRGDAGFTSDQVEYTCVDKRGRKVNVLRVQPAAEKLAR